MNLTDTPWIPIIRDNGSREKVSLIALFKEGETIRDLAVNPPQRIALMRFLICITQAALDGPQDEKAWFHAKKDLVNNVIVYLETWAHAFDLYGETPFMQAKDLDPLDNAVLDKLNFDLSAGNNSVLFDHEASPSGRIHSPEWCALMLLTFQCFSPGGLIGTTQWGKDKTTKTSEHAPAIEGSMLHTYIRGENLQVTIWMNLLTKEMLAEFPGMTFGRPIWEDDDVFKGNPEAARMSTQSYLGRLVPLSRAVFLDQNQKTFTLANGLSYPKLPVQREPCATVVRRGKEKNEKDMYISVNLARHPWRELSSVLSLSKTAIAGGAVCLRHLKYIKSDRVDIWTGGMAADKGKILDVAGWNFSLPIEMLNTTELLIYEKGVELARKGEYLLREAVKTWHKEMAVDSKSISYDKALMNYWALLDEQYLILIRCIGNSEPLGQAWFSVICRAMNIAYINNCPHTTPRQIQAFAIAAQKLRLKKPDH
ncbi:type I-E CRISPR-associated protein Cse1/CasA [Desulfobacter postgatei]|uniref:CRISPR type I-E protein CasA n=1 Tax=Desulfobacter postgatei 2ac9 TaxID=879212 RepID=I5B5K2_9BACT|nr:type I-E CRISPR-associated protein Cse1/CasA [Desulfobacter postgatei]EIM64765.1 CRISPR type I-E protein CasA [Desulfobacter postgatei 2ac9]